MSQSSFDKPAKLGNVLARLVRHKGLAERSSGQELENTWKQTAGERIAAKSHVRRINRGVLEVAVSNGAVLEELTCYLHAELLVAIQQKMPQQNIKSLKFVRSRAA